MKKLLFFAAMMLGLASCQTEPEGLDVIVGGEQLVNITVGLPETTRANSALSGVENNVLADHDMRFILEIYQGDKCYRVESIGKETSAVFPVRLVPGHEYDLVVWADFVKNGVDTYFDTSKGLDEIKMLNEEAMTEARDAYYGVYTLTEDKTPASIGTITLKRPFAKVRVVTTDLSECIESLGLQPQTATVTYASDVTVYNKFNARTKEVSVDNAAKTKSIDYSDSAYSEENLYVDYILVPQNTASVIKFDLNVTNVVSRSFNTDIAVEANKITTIKGNVLTNGSDIKVEVEDEFDTETIYLEGDVTLTENLIIDRPLVVRDDATAVLNLNGHNIKVNHDSGVTAESEGIIVYGNLTIEGEGTVEANTRAVWARGETGAKITINGGHYIGSKQNTEVIYASGNGQIEINGGTFEALTVSNGHGSANNRQFVILNLQDNKPCSIVVKGGSFKNFNPADNIAENPKHNFCAEGYGIYKNGDFYEVYYTGGSTIDITVNNAAELNAAMTTTDTPKTILLKAGEYGTIVAKSNYTLIGSEGANVDCVHLNGAENLTLKNINFDAQKAQMAYSRRNKTNYAVRNANIFTGNQEVNGDKPAINLTIDGCRFDGELKYGAAAIVLADQNRQGGYSRDITIKNCVFNTRGTGYDIYGYYTGNTDSYFVIENNIFDTELTAGGHIFLGSYASGIPVEVRNNKFNKTANFEDATYITSNSSYHTVSFIDENNTFAN